MCWKVGSAANAARNELIDALSSQSAIVRSEAAKTLAMTGELPEIFMPPLRQALRDAVGQSSRERVRAAETLLDLGESIDAMIPALLEFVEDEDWAAACWAMERLGYLRSAARSAIPALEAALNSERPWMEQEAYTQKVEITLKQIRDEELT